MKRLVLQFASMSTRHIGLITLIVLLTIISLTTIKPHFYLLGWDNYSSYFNLPTNMFRTLFSTWREYRGLGVPSDAESTDIFRQLFYWVTHLVFPAKLLDQVYYLFALWVGVLSLYGCARLLTRDIHVGKHSLTLRQKDLFGMTAALLYLFNLNTLSVFYSPIIPFTNRFYSLPLTLLMVLRLETSKHKSRDIFFFALIILVTSGSYITPTVIITSLIALGIFFVFRSGVKSAIGLTLILLCINAFWVLPFLNYTIEKSNIVPLARTFIEINESTLNRSSSTFSLLNQSILYPSFVDITLRAMSGRDYTIHPVIGEFSGIGKQWILFLFPLLYISGMILIVYHWKKYRWKLMWIPIWILLFLFLSMKEYSPVGFIYTFFTRTIPFFDMLFRISDTKFHAYISLAASFSGAYAIWFVLAHIQKYMIRSIVYGIVILVGSVYLWQFRSYINGNFIGFFAFNTIPSAYTQIATDINNTPGYGKVLHLPMDTWFSYWRSFSWGYLGSAFFNYLIDKPYIDKTFEPASLENSYLHTRIQNLLDSFYRTSDVVQKSRLADEFLALLTRTGIQFVLVDESITGNVYARNIVFSAKQWYIQSREMLTFLEQKGLVKRKNIYTIPLSVQYQYYRSLYPSNRIGDTPSDAPEEAYIVQYEIPYTDPLFHIARSVQNVDPDISNILETDVQSMTIAEAVVQDSSNPSQFIPFQTQQHAQTQDEDAFTLQYNNPNEDSGTYRLSSLQSGSDGSYLIDVSGRLDGSDLVLTFFHRYFPDINGKKFSKVIGSMRIPIGNIRMDDQGTDGIIISNWIQGSTKQVIDSYRLLLNDIVLPIPSTISSSDTSFGSFMAHDTMIRASLLTKIDTQSIAPVSFVPANPPSCLGVPPKDYQGEARITLGNSLQLMAYNGSTCVRATTQGSVSPRSSQSSVYEEIEVDVRGEYQKDQKEDSGSPTLGYLCIKEESIPYCLNPHRHFRVSDTTHSYRFPLRSLITEGRSYPLEIGVVSPGAITHSMFISTVSKHIYTHASEEYSFVFEPSYEEADLTVSGPLMVSFPKAISPYSFLFDPNHDTFSLPLEVCRGKTPSPRTITYEEDSLVSKIQNCGTHIAQSFVYAPKLPYLFTTQYWLGSGQQPVIVLGKDGDNYLLERLSLYQGYPYLPSLTPTTASRLIDPFYWSNSSPSDSAIHVFQDTANIGIMAVRSMNMIEYPASWRYITLTPQTSYREYQYTDKAISFARILPSLWKLTGPVPKGMLVFNEGYDHQWGIYDSWLGVLFGRSLTPSIRCNGYANCFDTSSLTGNTYYVFYWPERLAVLGWIVTGVTIIGAVFVTKKLLLNPKS